ncbi:MAG: class A beta-lactamase-related serine hydrolase [Betaproteobacteria bacterium]|nr:class A beta-lactamase-related serine hydrolase [Betaproteobacteria bacterium]
MTIRWIQHGAALAVLTVCAWVVQAQDLPLAKPEDAGMSSQSLERLDSTFKREIDQGRLPGVVMMVLRRGRLVYSAAMGVQEPGKPMTRDSIFRLYSMTKPWVSVAAIMLMEEGALQLSDPVSKFLPSMKGMQVSVARIDPALGKVSYTQVSADREITVQDLLRHTAGLVYGELSVNAPVKEAYTKAGFYSPEVSFDLRAMTPAEQVERLSKAPLAQQPGAVWEYGLASDVLGRVVEAASGKRLSEFLAERLFKPLKMTDSGFSVPKDKLARMAQPFEKDHATGTPNRLIDISKVPGNDSGGAGGVGTAADYLRFCQMLLNGGQWNGVRILSRTSVALMTSDHLGTKIQAPLTPGELLFGVQGYTFGLGFAVRQGPGVSQVPGSAGEYMWAGFAGTYFYADPKEELIGIYMSQAPGATRQYYRRLFKQLVSQAITD